MSIAPSPTDTDAERSASPDRLWRLWLTAIVVVYAVVQIAWLTATTLQPITLPDNLPVDYPQGSSPPQTLVLGTGPDEKEHYVYILSLAERGQLPRPTPEYRTSPDQFVSYQAQHPPLFYVLGALLYKLFAGGLGGTGFWYLLRGLCAAFGVAVILFAGNAARLAFPNRPLVAYGTPALVAFMPMLGHMMGCLSNEPMAMALTAWMWWLAVRIIRSEHPPTVRDGALVGLALGLAAETRMTALMWLPAAALVLFVAGRRIGKDGGALLPLAAFFAVFVVLVAPWLIHNKVAFGTPFFRTFDRPTITQGTTFADFWNDTLPRRADHPVSLNPRYTLLYFTSTAWTPYWLLKYYLPAPPGFNPQILWQILFVLLDAGAMIALVMHALYVRESKSAPDDGGRERTILWAAGLTVAVCTFATFEQQLYSDWTVVLSPGRYIIASVAASALLFAFAVSTLGERRKGNIAENKDGNRGAPRLVAPVILTVMILTFDIYSVSLVRTFYAQNPPQPSVQPIPKTMGDSESGQ